MRAIILDNQQKKKISLDDDAITDVSDMSDWSDDDWDDDPVVEMSNS